MAAYTDFSPPFAIVEGGHSKENTSAVKDELLEGSNELKQTIDKPPRDLSVVQHSASSAALVADTDLVSEKYYSLLVILSQHLVAYCYPLRCLIVLLLFRFGCLVLT